MENKDKTGMVVNLYLGKRREHSIKQHLGLKDIVTLIGAVFGFASIMFAIRAEFALSIIFLLLAGLFDFLDGKITRLFFKPNLYGKHLDTNSDVISFIVAPSVFIALYFNSTLGYASAIILLLCGLVRLSRFMVIDIEGYIGIPVTFSAFLIPLIYLANLGEALSLAIVLVFSYLMISTFHFKKI